MSEQVQLADYRARVADLYRQVREAADPAAGHALWRAGRDELFATHPSSPLAGLSSDDPLRTDGLPLWPYDAAYRFEVAVEPVEEPETREVDTGADGALVMTRVARVALPDPVAASLDVWWLEQYGGGLFVPLRDATSGAPDRGGASYGGGRYLLDTAKGSWLGGAGDRVVLDLNFAYHPSCRYDPRWQCPLAPAGNTIGARIEAGERL